MQRGPRRTHAGWGETQGLWAGSPGTGCSGRAAGPPCTPPVPPKPPHHVLPIYRVPPWPCCALAPGERGEREGAGEEGNATGPYPRHQPSAAGSDPSRRKLRGRAGSTGKAFHHRPPPPSPRLGWGCATLLQVAAQQTPAVGPGEEEEERRRVSGLCQTPTHGIHTPPASPSCQPLPTPPS